MSAHADTRDPAIKAAMTRLSDAWNTLDAVLAGVVDPTTEAIDDCVQALVTAGTFLTEWRRRERPNLRSLRGGGR